MTEPTQKVRLATYDRDEHRCVSCGADHPLQYQHRASEGMGGHLARPEMFEGLTSCASCNPAYEGHLQSAALAFGWKVRRWVRDQGLADRVPVFYVWERRWCVLTWDGNRVPVSVALADALMVDVYGAAEYWRLREAA